MAHCELLSTDHGATASPPSTRTFATAGTCTTPEACAAPATCAAPETYLALGLQSSAGRAGAVDLVAAHKWFNIAAAKGVREAARMRSEVAAEMSATDIAEAQRAARDFLRMH
jgi:TPR repeat protein